MSGRSLILVVLQFLCFAYYLFSGNLIAKGMLLYLQLFGMALSLWSAWVMGMGNFNIQPEVKPKARFVKEGPYRLLRNPMYTGLLLFFGALTISFPGMLHIAAFLLLSIVLVAKIHLEERYLRQRFGTEYEAYQKNTYRIIPLVY